MHSITNLYKTGSCFKGTAIRDIIEMFYVLSDTHTLLIDFSVVTLVTYLN